MPKITFHRGDFHHEQTVKDNANLVVLAGIKQFPGIKYGCGMGRCTKCVSKIIKGAEHLSEPNWKEVKMLGDKLQQGYRLTCQLFITADLELEQEE
ncbi:2Fe-2S iron-sulfur cluster-binding protein [Brevibacillus sp. B_LB10_24]|uniref:2Fe-2S iron-sulfur cluster-binding protein n=1 Tax=Brevibacillus sp. B_LB10_24 TaxID=3380645 RepID=UPI0038BD33EF